MLAADRLARAVFQTNNLADVPLATRERLLALAFIALAPEEAEVMDLLYGLKAGIPYDPADVAGMLMVHLGNPFALDQRDRVVADAQTSPITAAYRQGDGLRAALLDFEGNLLGTVSNTLGGLGVIFPYPLIAYRGWVGGWDE